MADRPSNTLPWPEAVGYIDLPDRTIARAADQFYHKKRFANPKNHTLRSLIRATSGAIFDPNLTMIDRMETVRNIVRSHLDHSSLESCIRNMEDLKEAGWYETISCNNPVTFPRVDLTILLNPNKVLTNNDHKLLLLYEYYRQTPRLHPDGVRALFRMVRLATVGKRFEEAHIVVLDCFNGRAYNDANFVIHEHHTIDELDRVLSRFNTAYRIHLDGSSPPHSKSMSKSKTRSRSAKADRMGFAGNPLNPQLCFHLPPAGCLI